MNKKIKIAIIRGGQDINSRREHSLDAGANLLLSAFNNDDIEFSDIHIDENGLWHHDGKENKLINVLPFYDHYIDTTHNVPRYRGLGHELFRHHYKYKSDINRTLSMRDIVVPKYVTLRHDINNKEDERNYIKVLYNIWRTMHMPIIISSDDKSHISILTSNYKDTIGHVEYLFRRDSDVIIKEYIEGDTYTVTTMPNYRGEKYYTPIVHKILKKKYSIWNLHSKDIHKDMHNSNGRNPILIRHDLSDEKLKELIKIVTKAHDELSIKHPLQWDVVIHKNKKVYIIKADPNPDFNPNSKFIKSINSTGINYVDLLKSYTDKAHTL